MPQVLEVVEIPEAIRSLPLCMLEDVERRFCLPDGRIVGGGAREEEWGRR